MVHSEWSLLVADWWNEIIFKRKQKQRDLYHYGSTNLGKSKFIEKVIGLQNLPFVY